MWIHALDWRGDRFHAVYIKLGRAGWTNAWVDDVSYYSLSARHACQGTPLPLVSVFHILLPIITLFQKPLRLIFVVTWIDMFHGFRA